MAKFVFGKGNKFGRGRPKGSGHVQICKEWAESKGWKRLMAMANGNLESFAVRGGKEVELGTPLELQLEAMKVLISYGYGRPPQGLELAGKDGGPIKWEIVSYKDA